MPTHFSYPPVEIQKELRCIAETLLSSGKGILAADESVSKMGKRFQEFNVENTEDLRRQWRQLLFTTDRKISDYIAGVILIQETLYQKDENGRLLIEHLKDRCIIPGIKVDTGLVNLFCSENEVATQGLDDLESRLAQYKLDGCEFAKWRCTFKITANTPSYRALATNADMLARYASICQSQRLCPIIEPEVVPEGDHDIERCQKVTETVLSFVYRALNDHHVFLEGTILKPNMVTAGLTSQSHANSSQIAKATVTAMQRAVPPAVPGICFSSGGQTEEEATVNLNAINLETGPKPWRLTFAFGRALQMSAMRAWGGKSSQTVQAQSEFLKRARANADASTGQYAADRDYQADSAPPPGAPGTLVAGSSPGPALSPASAASPTSVSSPATIASPLIPASPSTVTTEDRSGSESMIGLLGSSQISDEDYQLDMDADQSFNEFPNSL